MRHLLHNLLTALLLAACAGLLFAVYAARADVAHSVDAASPLAVDSGPFMLAQNLSVPFVVPTAPETPVSPVTPGVLPGTEAGPGTAVGTNPVTGLPCLGGGASAITGEVPAAPDIIGEPAQPGAVPFGLPPADSIFGLDSGTAAGAC
jgi:hypothetical protein